MAFLVGVALSRTLSVTPPDASSDLDRRWPIQIADASPSPLVRVEGAAFDTGGGAAHGVPQRRKVKTYARRYERPMTWA